MASYRYTLLAVSLALLLVLPPVVRAVDRRWEPFPAVLLPGEGSVVSLNPENVTTQVVRPYGRRPATNEWVAVGAADLLHPIPGVRFGRMYYRGVFAPLPPGPLREERAEFLGDRLERLGLSRDSLLIRTEAIAPPPKPGLPARTTVVKSYRLALD